MQSKPKAFNFKEALCALLSLFAVFVAWMLVKDHLLIVEGKGVSLAFCDSSPTSGCRLSALSPLSEIIPGVPVAGLAFGYFLVSFLISVSSFMKISHRLVAMETWGLFQFVSTCVSIFYLGAMVQSGHFCTGCLLVHGTNFILTGLRFSLIKTGLSRVFFQRYFSPSSAATYFFLIVTFTSTLVHFHSPKNILHADGFIISPESLNITTDSRFRVTLGKGKPISPMIMAIDLSCPHCKENLLNLSEALTTLQQKAEINLVLFPMDSQCNPYLSNRVLKSCTASRIAVCRAEEGNFEHFVRTSILDRINFIEDISEAVKLHEPNQSKQASLLDCVRSDATQAILYEQMKPFEENYDRSKISSVPTTWAMGSRVTGRLTARNWVSFLSGKLAPATDR